MCSSRAQGRLLSTLLAAIAEFERELIRERTSDCHGALPAFAGAFVKFGRKRKLSEYQRAEAIKRRASGETLASIARSYAVDISMITRLHVGRTCESSHADQSGSGMVSTERSAGSGGIQRTSRTTFFSVISRLVWSTCSATAGRP